MEGHQADSEDREATTEGIHSLISNIKGEEAKHTTDSNSQMKILQGSRRIWAEEADTLTTGDPMAKSIILILAIAKIS